jgi:peptidoglycan/LPS O-acetylase OafA/YrhL
MEGVQTGEDPAAGKLRSISPSFSAFLDLARALAATAVVLEHLRDPLFRGYPQLSPEARTLLVKAWYFLAGFGFEGVVVFFVLSGYLVGGLGIGRIRAGTFNLGHYAINRATRLFLVFVPGLLLTVAFDNLGARYTSAGFWTASNPVLLEKFTNSFIAADTPARFACNAAMLQEFACPVLGSNQPLWTLSYEFWFYVMFGLATVIILRKGAGRWTALVLGAPLLWFLGYKFVFMLGIWCLGLGVYLYRGKLLCRPILATACFLVTAVISRTINGGEPRGGWQDLVVLAEGASFAWLMISVRPLPLGAMLGIRGLASRVAGFSYTLYLVHFPTMLLLVALLFKVMGRDAHAGIAPNSFAGVFFYLLTFVAVMAFAWLFASVTEARTASVRRWLATTLTSRKNGKVERAKV